MFVFPFDWLADNARHSFLEHYQETSDVSESFMRLEAVETWEDLLVWGG